MGYPFGCDGPETEVECIRGGSATTNAVFFVLPSVHITAILFVSITMFRVYRTVHEVEVNAEKYSFLAKYRGNDKKKSRKMSRRVMMQGIAYSAVMILLLLFYFIWIVIYFVTNRHVNEVMMYIGIIFNTLNPLQGAFNALIYLIPFFRKVLKGRRQKMKSLNEKGEKEMLKEDNEESIKAKNVAASTQILASALSENICESNREQPEGCTDVILNGEGKEEEKEEEKEEITPLQVHIGSEINDEDKYKAKIVNTEWVQSTSKGVKSFDIDDDSDDDGDGYY